MNAILKFLQAARNLKKAGITKEQVLDFARREFGKVEGLLKKQIDDIFKKPDTGTKQQGTKGDVVPIKKEQGIMATDEAEAMSTLDTSENVAHAMRKLESKKMRADTADKILAFETKIKEMELKYNIQLDTAKIKADADLEKLITTNRNKTFLAAQQSSDRLQQQVNTLDGQPRTGQAPAGVDPSKQG